MNIIDCEQGDSTWFKARLGCVTSSKVANAIAKLKRKEGEAAVRAACRMEIVAETLSGKTPPHYVSEWMAAGIEKEPLARTAYEMLFGLEVRRVGLVMHPRIARGAASPDGIVGSDGLMEIKCPKTITHLQYMADGVVPEQYQPQMLWQMACCERAWCDFVSYDPDLPEDFQLFVKRFPRNDEAIAAMEAEVLTFLEEVDASIARLRELRKDPF